MKADFRSKKSKKDIFRPVLKSVLLVKIQLSYGILFPGAVSTTIIVNNDFQILVEN